MQGGLVEHHRGAQQPGGGHPGGQHPEVRRTQRDRAGGARYPDVAGWWGWLPVDMLADVGGPVADAEKAIGITTAHIASPSGDTQVVCPGAVIATTMLA
jgi:hypothetical protein